MTAASPLPAAVPNHADHRGRKAGPASAVALALLLAALSWASFRSAGGATGWLAWSVFSVSLLLTARLTGIAARFGGLDRQYAWHHRLGLVAYVLALAHPFALVLPWLTAGDVGTARFLWTHGAVAWTGWIALALLLVPMAVTFWAPLGFRAWLSWHRITVLAFVAIALHVATTSKQGSVAWWAIAIVGTAALALRAHVRRREAGHRYVISRVQHPAQACVEVELEPLDRRIEVRPGQYVFVAFHSGEAYQSCNEYHPFTVSAIRDGRITLTIKALGDCTLEMQNLTRGLAAHIEGPFGAFFDSADASLPQLWIAGGIGITPFLSQLDRLGTEIDVKMAYLFRAGTDALHMDELVAAAEARPGMELATFTTATDLAPLRRWLDSIEPLNGREVYVCGPPPLLDAVIADLRARGVAMDRIHFERFDFR